MGGTPEVLRLPEFWHLDPQRGTNLARNRYGWQKRAKEIARKQKNDEKMKRRQGKIPTTPEEDRSEAAEEGT
jgi:hypothetical protein